MSNLTTDQPTSRPTNKLIASAPTTAVIGLFVWEVFGPQIIMLAGTMLGIPLGGPAAAVVIPYLIGLVASGAAGVIGGIVTGWFVRDRVNVTVPEMRQIVRQDEAMRFARSIHYGASARTDEEG